MTSRDEWIKDLGLSPHPEGGYYLRTEESNQVMTSHGTEKKLYTSIYFLLTEDSPSHFHRLSSDEIWYYHDGQPLTVHCIFEDGTYEAIKVGKNIKNGERLHYTVPAGTIFGSTVDQDYALVSCAVIPGFDFSDFELFTRKELLELYPQHEEIIKKLAFEKI